MPAILIDFFQSLKAQAMATFMSFPSHHTWSSSHSMLYNICNWKSIIKATKKQTWQILYPCTVSTDGNNQHIVIADTGTS
jgi:hypothetical protein